MCTLNQAILNAIVTYAAACAFGNIYLIFLHESIYQSGTSFSRINVSCSSVNPFPLRTHSIILNDGFGGIPFFIR